ncbi:MAG: Rpn family recombination-promoting nuclease/putative transposase [Chloroflexota bacterium]
MSTPVADLDSPWKEAIEEYLPDCFALLFPAIAVAIDWQHPPEFLENELRQVMGDAELGPRRVDLLIRVRLRDGQDAWLLVHIEVQGQEEARFAQRMFVYFYRLFDRYARPVVSLAVLTDERPSWRPTTFALEQWGCTLHFSYPIVKLSDWRVRQTELAASDNPFATVVLAHLAAQDTRGDMSRRQRAKLDLARRLYQRGYGRERVLSLLRFIDWLLALPKEQEIAVRQEIRSWEEEQQMPYVTSFERLSRAEGVEEGLERGMEEGLERGRLEGKREAVRGLVEARFGTVPENLATRIETADAAALDALLLQVATAPSVAEI